MDGDQRRGTGRVEGDAGSDKVKDIGNAVGRNAHRRANAGVIIQQLAIQRRGHQLFVIAHKDANKDAGARASQLCRRLTAIFQRFPGRFQQHPVLGIHHHGFAGGYAKELRIKLIDLVDKTAPLNVGVPWFARLGIKEFLDIPAMGGISVIASTPFWSSSRTRWIMHATGQSTPKCQ